MIDYKAWHFWFGVGQYAIAVALWIYTWMSNRQKAQAGDLARTRQDVGKIETRVVKLETGTITFQELGKVYDRINEVSDQVSEMSGSVKGIERAVDRIQEYLMKNGEGR
jgi:uncharacterized protein Yka (UPF0111/DUF47 family)